MTATDRIKADIASNDVVLYMKGTPAMPQCGFSATVVHILDHVGVKYKGVNVLADPEIRQGIKDFSNWPTIPQLYVKGEFVGGCDIVKEMFESRSSKNKASSPKPREPHPFRYSSGRGAHPRPCH
jgi:monothiol glutaredoxin